MTATKVMDVTARQPGCAGRAADAVSAKTHVQLEDASTQLKLPKSECPVLWIRLPRHQWPKSWSNIEEPLCLLGEICMVTHVPDYSGKDSLKKVPLGLGWEKSTALGLLVCASSARSFPAVYVDDNKWLEEGKISILRGRN